MENQNERHQLRKRLLKIAGIFIMSYAIALGTWLLVGKYYGYIITYSAAHIIAPVKSLKLVKVSFDKKDKEIIGTYFRTQRQLSENIGLLQNVNYGHFTFNVPLTLAILGAFFPFITKKRVYIEAVWILIVIHLIYVIALEGYKLTEALIKSGYEPVELNHFRAWQYSEGFVKSMVLRFEPFLIGAYLYFSRNRGKDINEVEE